mgnify:CR=1 FL=1
MGTKGRGRSNAGRSRRRKNGPSFQNECQEAIENLRQKEYVELTTGSAALIHAARREAEQWIEILQRYVVHGSANNYCAASEIMDEVEEADRVLST